MNYNPRFFDYVDAGAIRSAGAVVRELLGPFQPTTVLDVGCGRGGWAAAWKGLAGARVRGLDGDYVDVKSLHIDPSEFTAIDLTRSFDLAERFDLVQCLEVAEHLPSESSSGLIQSLCRHGDVILFSAAVPGQGGTHHINERPLEYWRRLFRDAGYSAYDWLRPRIRGNPAVEPWYRYNAILYVNASGAASLAPSILASRVPEHVALPSFESVWWQLRRACVRGLPVSLVDALAAWNAKGRRVLGRVRPPGQDS